MSSVTLGNLGVWTNDNGRINYGRSPEKKGSSVHYNTFVDKILLR